MSCYPIQASFGETRMRRAFMTILFAASMAWIPACGSDSASNADATAPETVDETAAADPTPVETAEPETIAETAAETAVEIPAHCAALVTGMNTGFPVDDLKRSFLLTLPAGATGPGGKWPLVFNWHGFGDTAQNMNYLMSGSVDDASYPFILVTPESTGLEAIEWDMLQVYTDVPNKEARLFDEVLKCVNARWGVDPDKVHLVAFSAGSVCSDMLGVLRGDQLASIVTFSGGYLGDPTNAATVENLNVTWPDLTTANPYAQVLLTGGVTDQWGMASIVTIHFDQFAAADTTYLNGKGHDVVYCNHGKGHSAPAPGFASKQVVEFFKAHPRGTGPSPYTSAGLPSDFPAYCSFKPRQ